ncbi:hypothetical protein J4461_02405 [Candidatus Pacearchaeota archaeon]|nr:hypothetical protein [Candidatus Pacearchaeota archaeon]
MAEKTTSSREKKKSFFDVNAPITSSKISLYALSPSELNGRIVTLDMTRNLRGKNLEMKLRIQAEGDKLNAEPISIEIMGSYIRRMMRKGSDYVEDSFVTSCKDGQVVAKPFLITRNKVSRSVRNQLRVTAKEYLSGHFTTRTAKELFSEIISNKIQKELSLKLKKIYPLALCEIRIFSLIEQKK